MDDVEMEKTYFCTALVVRFGNDSLAIELWADNCHSPYTAQSSCIHNSEFFANISWAHSIVSSSARFFHGKTQNMPVNPRQLPMQVSRSGRTAARFLNFGVGEFETRVSPGRLPSNREVSGTGSWLHRSGGGRGLTWLGRLIASRSIAE
jgi:hypothetical protein